MRCPQKNMQPQIVLALKASLHCLPPTIDHVMKPSMHKNALAINVVDINAVAKMLQNQPLPLLPLHILAISQQKRSLFLLKCCIHLTMGTIGLSDSASSILGSSIIIIIIIIIIIHHPNPNQGFRFANQNPLLHQNKRQNTSTLHCYGQNYTSDFWDSTPLLGFIHHHHSSSNHQSRSNF